MPKIPPKLGNINAAMKGVLQVIDNTQWPARWRTVGECADTPNSIGNALLNLQGRDAVNVWIKTADGRRPLF